MAQSGTAAGRWSLCTVLWFFQPSSFCDSCTRTQSHCHTLTRSLPASRTHTLHTHTHAYTHTRQSRQSPPPPAPHYSPHRTPRRACALAASACVREVAAPPGRRTLAGPRSAVPVAAPFRGREDCSGRAAVIPWAPRGLRAEWSPAVRSLSAVETRRRLVRRCSSEGFIWGSGCRSRFCAFGSGSAPCRAAPRV